jgi:hypothetical protein
MAGLVPATHDFDCRRRCKARMPGARPGMRVQEAIVGVGAFAMEIRAIRTEADYDAALKEIEQYFEMVPETGTLEASRFDVLAALIGAYERVHWSIEAATKPVTVAPRGC